MRFGVGVEVLEFMVYGLWFGVEGLGVRVQEPGRVGRECVGFRVGRHDETWARISGSGYSVQGLGSRV